MELWQPYLTIELWKRFRKHVATVYRETDMSLPVVSGEDVKKYAKATFNIIHLNVMGIWNHIKEIEKVLL